MSTSRSSDFEALFGAAPLARASAPGRVNLIGEHTDYQGGFVLPIAIPQRTEIELRPGHEDIVRVASANVPGSGAMASYRLGEERAGRGWVDYVQGVTWALRERGQAVGGFDARVSSEVPVGSGLSSSAALEVALVRALREAFGLALDDLEVARAAHRAETGLVGAPVGVMDQMACSLADVASALYLDTRALTWDKVPLPPGVRIGVIDSRIPHEHATGAYRTRRAEAEAAARALDVPLLRELGEGELARVEALPEPLRRRARHIVTENARVQRAVAAMRAGDVHMLGALLEESHRSLWLDYEVTVPNLDLLVGLARRSGGVLGARMTGGGFGGAVVLLLRADAPQEGTQAIAREYADRTGTAAAVLVP